MKKRFYLNTALTMALMTLVSVQGANAQGLPSMPDIPQAPSNQNFTSESFSGSVPRTNVNIGGPSIANTAPTPGYIQPNSDIPGNLNSSLPIGTGVQRQYDDNGFLIPNNPTQVTDPSLFATGPQAPAANPNENYVSPYTPMNPPLNPQGFGNVPQGGMMGQQSPEESPIPGGPTSFEKPVPELPVAGEPMSLSGFDNFYGDLMKDVENRLGDLTTEKVGNENSDSGRVQDILPNASVSEYSTDLDKLSNVQREIRMLQLRLQQATLAKEVYDTIYPDKLEVYEERITELEDHIIKQDEENKVKLAEVESEKSDLEFKISEFEFELTNVKSEMDDLKISYEGQISELQDSLDESEEKLEEAEAKLEKVNGQLEYLGGAGPNGGMGTFSNADGQIIMGPTDADGNPLFNTLGNRQGYNAQPVVSDPVVEEKRLLMPGVSRVFGMSGRFFTRIEMPDGGIISGSVGTTLPNGMEIVKITSYSVETVLDGERFELFLGPAEKEVIPTQPSSNMDPMGAVSNMNPGLDPSNMGNLPMNPFANTLNNTNENIVMPISPPSNFGQ